MAPKKKAAPKKVVPQKRNVKDPDRGRDEERKSPRAKMAQNRAQAKRRESLIYDDYQYAMEVAGQPASNRYRREQKRKAEKDMAYLESKYPNLKRKKK